MAKGKRSQQDTAKTDAEPNAEAAPQPPAAAETTPAGHQVSILDSEGLPPDEVARILQKRTRALAQVPPAKEEGETIQVVVFALGEETYAVEATHVEDIRPLRRVTPVPCTPDFVVGVVNLRGRILCVIDLRRFMGLENLEIDEESQLLTVSAKGLEVGVLVSQVRAVSLLLLDKLDPTLPTTAQVASTYTRGITPDNAVLLDLEAVMGDGRMIVREEA